MSEVVSVEMPVGKYEVFCVFAFKMSEWKLIY
jgi:hypothetical protein